MSIITNLTFLVVLVVLTLGLVGVWVVAVISGGGGRICETINKTKHLMILRIHKSIKTEFIMKLNEDKLGKVAAIKFKIL